MTERESKLVFSVDERNDFSHYPSPFLLLGRHDSVNRFKALVVQFALKQMIN